MTHFIAMAGLHGYIPNTCQSYDTLDAAVDDLSTTHELGKKRRAALKRDLYLELNLKRDGNEYCSIETCDCATPEIHNDI